MVRQMMKGEQVSEEDCIAVNRKVNAKIADYSAKEIETMSIQELLDQVEFSPVQRRLISSRLQASYCATLDQVALRSTGTFSTHEGPGRYFRVDGGNQALARSLASSLPEVLCNRPVTEIKQDAEGVIVRTENETFSTDKLVLSVPISVISKIEFSPALPEEVQHAIAVTKLGSAAKLSAVLTEEPPLLARQENLLQTISDAERYHQHDKLNQECGPQRLHSRHHVADVVPLRIHHQLKCLGGLDKEHANDDWRHTLKERRHPCLGHSRR